MKHTLIISGGNIEEDFALRFLEEQDYDYLIAADHGLLFLKKYGLMPTHIVGDFDSAGTGILADYEGRDDVRIRRFRPEKDWTDTEIALELAMELGSTKVTIIGATGTRLDHVMGNIQLLALASQRGVDCFLADPHNKIYLREQDFEIRREEQWGEYVSFFAYGGDVTGLTMRGMKYEVTDFTLGNIGTRAVSNEIAAETGRISFVSGKLLVMETKD